MQWKSVKRILVPLIKGGRDWQSIDINGKSESSKYFFHDLRWIIFLISIISILILPTGLSRELLGYVMSAFAITVSLFMSLLVNIFDKFENTDLSVTNKNEHEIVRLKQKKNFFKKFISITSYLVVLSIFIILLCSLSYIFNLSASTKLGQFSFDVGSIDFILTLKNSLLLLYRIMLNYFLLNYLLLTLFITSSAYEYYISEIDRRKIK